MRFTFPYEKNIDARKHILYIIKEKNMMEVRMKKTLWHKQLNEWVQSLIDKGQTLSSIAPMIQLPEKKHITLGHLSNMLSGRRGVSLQMGKIIEKVSGGKVLYNSILENIDDNNEAEGTLSVFKPIENESVGGPLPESMRQDVLRGSAYENGTNTTTDSM
jgi:hypothetical protein